MKILLTAAVAFSTLPLLAQAGEQGVSHPDNTPILTDDQVTKPSTYKAKPSPYNVDANIVTTTTLPATAPTTYQDDANAYHPYHPAGTIAPALTPRRVSQADASDFDPDANIVTETPLRPGEIGEGSLIKVRMNEPLSTVSTLRGQPFSATLTEDVLRDGVPVIPAGAVLDGTVTEVHGGKRIAGRAAIHLEPRRITLPNGHYYVLHAQVIESGEEHAVRVDGEGSIVRRDHAKEMLAVAALTTGSGAATGAVFGGGVGAIVGASIGAGVGTVVWLRQDRQAALPRNTPLIFSLTTPLVMQPLQDGAALSR